MTIWIPQLSSQKKLVKRLGLLKNKKPNKSRDPIQQIVGLEVSKSTKRKRPIVVKIKIKMLLTNLRVNRSNLLQDTLLDLGVVVINQMVKIQTEVPLKKKRKKRKNQNIRKMISLIH